MSKRNIWRQGDENVCSLGFRWDVYEPDPHFDSVVYELQQKLIISSQEGEQPVAKYLAELVNRCLHCDDDSPAHVSGMDLIRRIDKAAITNERA